MHRLMKSSLVDSLRVLATGPHLLPESEIEIIGPPSQQVHLADKLVRQIDTEIPWFLKESDGRITTPQHNFFGLYALRNILRGMLIGASFIPAGDMTLNHEFLSPAVALYYTASLHLILAYLALEGRVLITPVYGRPYIEYFPRGVGSGHKPILNGPTAVCSILTDEGKWIFEGRSRTHRTYWAEVDKLMNVKKESLPIFFIEFAHYLVGPFTSKDKNEKDLVRSAISQLQDARHEALYSGYGLDPISDDMLTNGDADWAPLNLRAKEFKSFAYGLLNHVLKETSSIIDCFNDQCPKELAESRLKIWVSVRTPPFDLRNDLDDILQQDKCDSAILRKIVKQFLFVGQ
jgi:hypothetical protein